MGEKSVGQPRGRSRRRLPPAPRPWPRGRPANCSRAPMLLEALEGKGRLVATAPRSACRYARRPRRVGQGSRAEPPGRHGPGLGQMRLVRGAASGCMAFVLFPSNAAAAREVGLLLEAHRASESATFPDRLALLSSAWRSPAIALRFPSRGCGPRRLVSCCSQRADGSIQSLGPGAAGPPEPSG